MAARARVVNGFAVPPLRSPHFSRVEQQPDKFIIPLRIIDKHFSEFVEVGSAAGRANQQGIFSATIFLINVSAAID